MSLLASIIARGVAASRPAVGDVPIGSLYYSTDTGALERNSGSAWESVAPTGAAPGGGAGGVLSGTYPNPGFAADMATQAELDAHTGDTTAAHAATAIAFTPAGTIAATTVQAAIEEVAAEAGGTSLAQVTIINVVLGGSGAVIAAGFFGHIRLPFTGTITAVALLADVSGSIVIDLWRDTHANAPPTVADTITASAKPTLAAAQKSQDTTLTGWSTGVTAGDWLGVNVDSAATVTQVTLAITIERTA